MFRNTIITTFRHLLKRPFYLFINISGLTLGVLVCTLLALYVHTELSADKGLAKSEHTYRLLRMSERNGESYRIGVTSAPFAEAIVNDYPIDVEASLRVYTSDGLVSIDDNTRFNEDQFYLADSNFFKFFNYEFIYGDELTALSQPQSVVLTEELAKQYYGNENPLNKIIRLDQSLEFNITGVVKTPENKTHIRFNMIATNELLKEYESFTQWWSNNLVTYIQLNPSTDFAQFESQLPAFMDKYFGEDFKNSGTRIDLSIQKFDDIYFGNDVQYDQYAHGNLETVYIFTAIGLFIMIIACINFMNISTAMASMRAREVGIKKIMGSGKGQLMLQYLTESFIICTISVLLAFMMLEIVLPSFNSIYGLNLVINWLDPIIIIYGALIIVTLVLISGIYPALLLSSFKPLKVLGGKGFSGNTSTQWIRKGLVVFQFACSIILLITTTVIWKQMDYVMNKPLGFDKSHVITIWNNNSDIRSNIDLFKERVEQIQGVQSVSKIVGEPGGFHDTMNFRIEGTEDTQRMRTVFSDEDYLECFGIPIISGRFFRKDNQVDRENSIVLNETAVKLLGFTNETILGQRIQNIFVDTTFREVIGVVKDYNFSSLKSNMEPLAMAPSNYNRKIAIKLDAGHAKKAIAEIQNTYERIVNLYPFEYEFLDNNIEKLYAEEKTQQGIFVMFSIISIVIGCLGIFGLATFTANQRAREISIRKVLGASVINISYMLGNQFIKLVLIANLVAWPLAYYFMNEWLSGFAYRISLGFGSFVLAMLLALVIAILTVSYQAIKAALINPATTLRNE